jgi:RND family efflux transporter MFP subunit
MTEQKKHLNRRQGLVVLLLVAALGTWVGFGVAERLVVTFNPPPPEAVRPLVVETMVLTPQDLERWRRYPGSIAAERQINLSSRTTGRIEEMPFRSGTRVQENALLVLLDDRELRQELVRLDLQTQAIAADLDLARRKLARQERLYADAATPAEAAEEARNRVEFLAASLAANHEMQAIAATRLDYARVRAPFAGMIGQIYALPGDLASPGQPLLELVADDELKAVFVIPQGDLAEIRPGAPVRITAADFSLQETGGPIREALPAERSWAGSLDRLHPSLETPGRGARAEALLPRGVEGLRPGMTAVVEVLAERAEKALVIPAEALHYRALQPHVFVVEEERARRREVVTGPEAGGLVVVLAGLEAGEKIITTPYPDLADGRALQLVSPPPADGDSAVRPEPARKKELE